MVVSPNHGLEEAPQASSPSAAPLPTRREAGSASRTQLSFTSHACDLNGEPLFGDHVAEEIIALYRKKYSTEERESAAMKRELAELQAQVAGLRLRLAADTLPKPRQFWGGQPTVVGREMPKFTPLALLSFIPKFPVI